MFDPESMAAYYFDQYYPPPADKYDLPLPVRCKFCRKSEFHWQKTERGWRLFTKEGKLHSCKKGREKYGHS